MRYKKGKVRYMAIKIDLEKFYDKLQWEFVEDVLKEVDLLYSIQKKIIMNCITTSFITILWHRSKMKEFKPSRGIK